MVLVVFPTTAVILGDSLIYIVLPAYAANFGVVPTLGIGAGFWLGLALSINRFVRLISNVAAANTYQRFGFRIPFIAATVLGTASTLSYALGSSIIVLLLARTAWGISYSFLRLAGQLAAFELGDISTRGRLMGFFNAGQRLGSFIAVTAGALLVDLTSHSATFTVLAGIGMLGILVATRSPNLSLRKYPLQKDHEKNNTFGGYLERVWNAPVTRMPAGQNSRRILMLTISILRFGAAFTSNGLIIATISPYLSEILEGDPTIFGFTARLVTLAGIIIGIRWFADLALSIQLGHISDTFGRRRTIFGSATIAILSLVLAATTSTVELLVLALAVTFIAGLALEITLDVSMGETAPDHMRADAMARRSTWSDLGAAIGPLAGFLIGPALGFDIAYCIGAALIGLATSAYLLASRQLRNEHPIRIT